MNQPIAVVVYDASNDVITRIAKTFADNLTAPEPAHLIDAASGERPDWGRVRLLVIGTPTVEKGPSPAIDSWLEGLEAPPRRLAFATFDARRHGGWMRRGNGARKVSRQLERAGFLPNMGMETFFLDGEDGNLEEGQVKRAAKWAIGLAIATGTRSAT